MSNRMYKWNLDDKMVKDTENKNYLFTLHTTETNDNRCRITTENQKKLKAFPAIKIKNSIPNNNFNKKITSADILSSLITETKPIRNIEKVNLMKIKKLKLEISPNTNCNQFQKYKLISNDEENKEEKLNESYSISNLEKIDNFSADDIKYSNLKKYIKWILTGNEEIWKSNHNLIELNEKKKKMKENFDMFLDIRQLPHIKNKLSNSLMANKYPKELNLVNANSIDSKTNFILNAMKRNLEINKEEIKMCAHLNEGKIEESIFNYFKSNREITEKVFEEEKYLMYTSYFLDKTVRYKNTHLTNEKIKNCILNLKKK